MKRLCTGTISIIMFWALAVSAQSKSPIVGTWNLDTAKSEFSSTRVKSLTVVFSQDTPDMLVWHGQGIDGDGKPMDIAWSGPENGSMHSTMENGKPTFNQSAKKAEDGAILRHGEFDEGSFDSRLKVSSDGKTLVDEIFAKSKDGKESKEKHVYRRVSTP
ncbi:MAG TPA: hypothetical protein VH596_08060 [Terriglobales bacterium]|jgi:hypothetical protein